MRYIHPDTGVDASPIHSVVRSQEGEDAMTTYDRYFRNPHADEFSYSDPFLPSSGSIHGNGERVHRRDGYDNSQTRDTSFPSFFTYAEPPTEEYTTRNRWEPPTGWSSDSTRNTRHHQGGTTREEYGWYDTMETSIPSNPSTRYYPREATTERDLLIPPSGVEYPSFQFHPFLPPVDSSGMENSPLATSGRVYASMDGVIPPSQQWMDGSFDRERGTASGSNMASVAPTIPPLSFDWIAPSDSNNASYGISTHSYAMMDTNPTNPQFATRRDSNDIWNPNSFPSVQWPSCSTAVNSHERNTGWDGYRYEARSTNISNTSNTPSSAILPHSDHSRSTRDEGTTFPNGVTEHWDRSFPHAVHAIEDRKQSNAAQNEMDERKFLHGRPDTTRRGSPPMRSHTGDTLPSTQRYLTDDSSYFTARGSREESAAPIQTVVNSLRKNARGHRDVGCYFPFQKVRDGESVSSVDAYVRTMKRVTDSIHSSPSKSRNENMDNESMTDLLRLKIPSRSSSKIPPSPTVNFGSFRTKKRHGNRP